MRRSLALAFPLLLLLAVPVRADDPPAPPPAPPAKTPAPLPAPPAGSEPAPAPKAAPGSAPAPEEKPQEKPARKPEAEPDTVVLKNGSVWSGHVVEETATSVTVECVSESGGVGRFTFQRSEIQKIRRGRAAGKAPEEGGPELVRDEWFLLRSGGRIVGTRRLQLWSVRRRGEPGFRLEEKIGYFAQGPQMPATRSDRTEDVDLRFFPRLVAYHEEGDPSPAPNGPRRYTRNVSGRVVDGVWRGSSFVGGEAHTCRVPLPPDTRGRLGLREHLLHMPRRVQLVDTHVLEPDREAVLDVRAGFASVTPDPKGKRPGQELHWEEDGHRFISWFGDGQRVIREQIGEDLVAIPVSAEQAEAAAQQAEHGQEETGSHEIVLPEAGLAFQPPGPVWSWKPQPASPANTGWRVLGRLSNSVLLADVRVEWHPRQGRAAGDPAAEESWLLHRLRFACPDVAVVARRAPLARVQGAWRIGLQGTLRKESVRTVAVVVDRPGGRVVLLLACPAGAWESTRPAFDRLLDSLRAL
jgi:hypothetical protein